VVIEKVFSTGIRKKGSE